MGCDILLLGFEMVTLMQTVGQQYCHVTTAWSVLPMYCTQYVGEESGEQFPLFLSSCLILLTRKMCTEALTGFVKEFPVLCNMMETDCKGSKKKR